MSRPYFAQVAAMVGKRIGRAGAERRAVEVDAALPAPAELVPDRASDDVTAGKLAPRIGVEHEPMSVAVDDERAFATHRLADEEAWRTLHGERGRVELRELHAGDLGAAR